jgi:hypothetical protein
MKVEMGKEYTTRDGKPVRIYAVDGGGQFPVHWAVRDDDGSWIARASKIDGTWGPLEDRRDLIEAPRKFRLERWVNVYGDESVRDGGKIHNSREEADTIALFVERTLDQTRRIACVRIVIEGAEGDGLTTNPKPENAQ